MHLHGPDRTTPFAETFEAVDKEYRAGRFEEFGLSNFTAAEVQECIAMCKDKGWVLPTVYQGHYNAITRGAEKDLIPVLREHGIRFHAFS
jgi:aflatoxin B1 aldehyde reductase